MPAAKLPYMPYAESLSQRTLEMQARISCTKGDLPAHMSASKTDTTCCVTALAGSQHTTLKSAALAFCHNTLCSGAAASRPASGSRWQRLCTSAGVVTGVQVVRKRTAHTMIQNQKKTMKTHLLASGMTGLELWHETVVRVCWCQLLTAKARSMCLSV